MISQQVTSIAIRKRKKKYDFEKLQIFLVQVLTSTIESSSRIGLDILVLWR